MVTVTVTAGEDSDVTHTHAYSLSLELPSRQFRLQMSLIIPQLEGLSPQGFLGACWTSSMFSAKKPPLIRLSQANMAQFTPYL